MGVRGFHQLFSYLDAVIRCLTQGSIQDYTIIFI